MFLHFRAPWKRSPGRAGTGRLVAGGYAQGPSIHVSPHTAHTRLLTGRRDPRMEHWLERAVEGAWGKGKWVDNYCACVAYIVARQSGKCPAPRRACRRRTTLCSAPTCSCRFSSAHFCAHQARTRTRVRAPSPQRTHEPRGGRAPCAGLPTCLADVASCANVEEKKVSRVFINLMRDFKRCVRLREQLAGAKLARSAPATPRHEDEGPRHRHEATPCVCCRRWCPSSSSPALDERSWW